MQQISNFLIADYGLNFAINLKTDIIATIKEPIDDKTQIRITAIALGIIGGSFIAASAVTALTSIPLVLFNPVGAVTAVVSIVLAIISGHDMAAIGTNLRNSLIVVPEPPEKPEEPKSSSWIAFLWDPTEVAEAPTELPPPPPPRIPYYYDDTWFAKDLYDALLTRYETIKA